MNSKNKIIRLGTGIALLFALLAFQGSTNEEKGCFDCKSTTPVTFINSMGIEIYLVVSGAKTGAFTMANNVSVNMECPAGSYDWVAYSDFVVQNGQVSGDVDRTGNFAVTDDTPKTIVIK